MKRTGILTTLIALSAMLFSGFDPVQDHFVAASADDYEACAKVSARYDEEAKTWSADFDILISNTTDKDLHDIPIRVVPKVSVLKDQPSSEIVPIPEEQFNYTDDTDGCVYQNVEHYGLGGVEAAGARNACSVARLDEDTDAVLRFHYSSSPSYVYLKYEIQVGEKVLETEYGGRNYVYGDIISQAPGDITDTILGSAWIDSNLDSVKQDTETAVQGALVKLIPEEGDRIAGFAVTGADGSFAISLDQVSGQISRLANADERQRFLDARLEVMNVDHSACTFPVIHTEHKVNETESHLVSIREVTEGNKSCVVAPVPYSQTGANPFLETTFADIPFVVNPEEMVQGLYQTVLSREAEEPEVRSWTNKLVTNEISAETLVKSFFKSKEFSSKELTDEEFLDIVYQAVLGRKPDVTGKANWLSWLEKGATRDIILRQFIYSVEFRNCCEKYGVTRIVQEDVPYSEKNVGVTSFVNRLYQVLLERAGEPSGLEYWCKLLLDKEMTGDQVARGFVESKEFVGRGLSDEEYVTLLYKSILGREPDSDGKVNWVKALADGASRSAVYKGFSYSVEFKELCDRYGIAAR